MSAQTEKCTITMASEHFGLLPSQEECVYTKCYCEENVWKLCQHVQQNKLEDFHRCFVVFISNTNRTVPLWQQRASSSEDAPVVWDYHVILIHRGQRAMVYDLDTRLSFPCVLDTYLREGIKSDVLLKEQYHRCFRVITAEVYMDKFASDRSHMMKEDQSWMAPPPTYPCIRTADSTNNIDDFISMDPPLGWGTVMDLNSFTDNFLEKST